MTLYNVNEEYINYLRLFEHKVLLNKQTKRPYVGVVYKINDFNYYIPLASPKEKHLYMKNSKDFHKIKGGQYGVINFNKMIPISKEELLEINIENEPDTAYKYLLQNQYRELLNIKDIIFRKSRNLYELFIRTDNLSINDIKVKDRCCNFILLEHKMQEYIIQKQINDEAAVTEEF